MSIGFRAEKIINDECQCSFSFLATYGGPMAQVRRLDPKVSSRLALFCIHRVNRVNARNDS